MGRAAHVAGLRQDLDGLDRLADLALELLPVDGADVGLDLLLFLRVDPMLDAVEVDQANGALACARHHQRVFVG